MQRIKIILLLLTFLPVAMLAQQAKSTNQTKTIQINNDKGKLYISFAGDDIVEFIVNDEPVAVDEYGNYQTIIDEFSGEEYAIPASPTPPAPTAPPAEDNRSEAIRGMLLDYFTDNAIITSDKKYKVQLNTKYVKVNGKKLSNEMHKDCLILFVDVYGHDLNTKSEVKFKKSKRNSSSSIRIVM